MSRPVDPMGMASGSANARPIAHALQGDGATRDPAALTAWFVAAASHRSSAEKTAVTPTRKDEPRGVTYATHQKVIRLERRLVALAFADELVENAEDAVEQAGEKAVGSRFHWERRRLANRMDDIRAEIVTTKNER